MYLSPWLYKSTISYESSTCFLQETNIAITKPYGKIKDHNLVLFPGLSKEKYNRRKDLSGLEVIATVGNWGDLIKGLVACLVQGHNILR